MSRPRKCRKVCFMPNCTQLIPSPRHCELEIIMTVDEYETIRLIDLEGLTQEQCADQMEIARTTVQAIYSVARKKLAECLVYGRLIKITGGDIQVCEGANRECGCCCRLKGNAEENPVEGVDESIK